MQRYEPLRLLSLAIRRKLERVAWVLKLAETNERTSFDEVGEIVGGRRRWQRESSCFVDSTIGSVLVS